ncbi:trafficking protein particle complex subunit 13 [Eurytemora carolleeae]|uniref:trafficking protein particle complex subunit 13 n=1 Tax=Eurytemora carolleeae TaxID=1294199 RepID=UPI000C794585|nr:trafficking protein particle complex subunit 13 [Eurytemora carolleeae]|eukprot:XP_023335859.1 trafficking protein particle complex subunit 13-like [Eurytemora affinis]
MGDTRVEHCLALKVMRLTKPTLGLPSQLHSDRSDLTQDLLIENLKTDVNSLDTLEGLNLGKLLILPQSFGNIYLGETFSSYVCVHNDSTETCRNVSVKADLQTGTQRIGLVTGQERLTLAPGETIDHVIHHEVKELGTHILVCDVTYASPTSDKLNFRKFFKFQVMKPLDVKTKFYNAESDEVFLEAQVQNITLGNINLDRVVLEPSSVFTVKPIHLGTNDNTGVFSSGTCLQSQDSWQFLFCLSPRPDLVTEKTLKSLTNIGKLDIVWRSAYCDKGRLQTSQLQRLAPNTGDLKVSVLHSPALALIYQPLPIQIRITNNCDRTLELEQNLDLNSEKISWVGVTNTNLGLLEPGGSIKIGVELVLQECGLQSLPGLQLKDSLLTRVYEFNDLAQIFCIDDQDLFSFIKSEYIK